MHEIKRYEENSFKAWILRFCRTVLLPQRHGKLCKNHLFLATSVINLGLNVYKHKKMLLRFVMKLNKQNYHINQQIKSGSGL